MEEVLPADLWHKVFSYLKAPTLCNLSLVSKQFFTLASEQVLWFLLWHDLWHRRVKFRGNVEDWRRVYLQYHQLLKLSEDTELIKNKLHDRLSFCKCLPRCRVLLVMVDSFDVDDPIYALALLYRYAGLAIALYDINPEKCPFELVIHFSNKNVAKRLLENGYDPNTVKLDVPYVSALQEEGFGWGSLAWNSKPILHYAACHGDTDFVRMLLVKGAHIDMPARYQSPDSYETATGKTPLQTACYFGNLNVAQMLIQNKADVNSITRRQMDPSRFGKALFTCDTPLICAVAGGHLDVVKLLVQHGADPTFQVDSGLDASKNAVEIALLLGFDDIYSFLNKATGWCGIM